MGMGPRSHDGTMPCGPCRTALGMPDTILPFRPRPDRAETRTTIGCQERERVLLQSRCAPIAEGAKCRATEGSRVGYPQPGRWVCLFPGGCHDCGKTNRTSAQRVPPGRTASGIESRVFVGHPEAVGPVRPVWVAGCGPVFRRRRHLHHPLPLEYGDGSCDSGGHLGGLGQMVHPDDRRGHAGYSCRDTHRDERDALYRGFRWGRLQHQGSRHQRHHRDGQASGIVRRGVYAGPDRATSPGRSLADVGGQRQHGR